MKNIFIILVLTLAVGISSMLVTEVILRNAERKMEIEQEMNVKPETSTQSALDALTQSSQEVSDQIRRSNERDKKSLIAGAIGTGIGFIGGLSIVMLRDKKKRTN
jgi:transcriptional regulator with AAA-type ATPase domain